MTVKQYRKKPVVIEAMRCPISDTPEVSEHIVKWINGDRPPPNAWFDVGSSEIFITTLEGIMKASPGDYIIKGVNGEFYPCKPDIFLKTYEEVL